MAIVGRIIGLAFVGMAATMAAGAVAAMSAKQRIVPTTDPAEDEISLASIFGPLAWKSTSTNFKGGTVECWYGGGAVDLRDATLSREGATLNLKAVFGGGQILVPPSWPVVTHVTGIGGLVDARPAAGHPADAPTLTIEGTVVFGGFQILAELPEGQEGWLRDHDTTAEAAGTDATGSDAPPSSNGIEPTVVAAG